MAHKNQSILYLLIGFLLFLGIQNVNAQEREANRYFVTFFAVHNYNDYESDLLFNGRTGATFFGQPFLVEAENVDKITPSLVKSYLECNYDNFIGSSGLELRFIDIERKVAPDDFSYNYWEVLDEAVESLGVQDGMFDRRQNIYGDWIIYNREVVSFDLLKGYETLSAPCSRPKSFLDKQPDVHFRTLNVGIGTDDVDNSQYSLGIGVHSKTGFFGFETGFYLMGNKNITLSLPMRMGAAFGSSESGLFVTGGADLSLTVQKDNDNLEDFTLPYGFDISYYKTWGNFNSKGIYIRYNSYLGEASDTPVHIYPLNLLSVGYVFN
ncbi:MAG: hypothetical protein HUJ22_10115 [Gracilimonas sp.]|uniref:hypothetical protein n=1 Tax=Gracilimonas sp. TaxID=1974203 RepID=UPI00198751AA|nr:hypothetical protein [Gracilimonas sp.]MBD3616915.1 hypothetical protein [Gracilimonas sp.]